MTTLEDEAAVTVIHACLEAPPILPHMAEDIWQNLPYDVTAGDSVFWREDGQHAGLLNMAREWISSGNVWRR
jgi:isoleucyl-tRNA synthetase